MVKMKTTYKLSVGNPERRRPSGGLTPITEHNIKTDLK
jgi:hypothetical protein